MRWRRARRRPGAAGPRPARRRAARRGIPRRPAGRCRPRRWRRTRRRGPAPDPGIPGTARRAARQGARERAGRASGTRRRPGRRRHAPRPSAARRCRARRRSCRCAAVPAAGRGWVHAPLGPARGDDALHRRDGSRRAPPGAPRSHGGPSRSLSPARWAAVTRGNSTARRRCAAAAGPAAPRAGGASPRPTTATGNSCTPSAPTSAATPASGKRVYSRGGQAGRVGQREQLGQHRAGVPVDVPEAALR